MLRTQVNSEENDCPAQQQLLDLNKSKIMVHSIRNLQKHITRSNCTLLCCYAFILIYHDNFYVLKAYIFIIDKLSLLILCWHSCKVCFSGIYKITSWYIIILFYTLCTCFYLNIGNGFKEPSHHQLLLTAFQVPLVVGFIYLQIWWNIRNHGCQFIFLYEQFFPTINSLEYVSTVVLLQSYAMNFGVPSHNRS